MYLQSETNIIVSGKASSGTSVTSLFLAYLLNKKYIFRIVIRVAIKTHTRISKKKENTKIAKLNTHY